VTPQTSAACMHTLLELIAAVEEIAVSEGAKGAVLAEWLNHAKTTAESLNPVRRIVKALIGVDRVCNQDNSSHVPRV